MALKLSSGDYERIRKEANAPTKIRNPDPKKLRSGKKGTGVTEIPPLNVDARYASFLPKIDKQFTAKLRAEDLPEYFNINDKLKDVATPVPNQMRCGSCWAFATAGVLNDNFAVKYGVNPNLSPSYILSFFSDDEGVGAKCSGGNPGSVINLLNQYPVLTNNCMDYSWCKTSGNCSGDATQHFDKDPNFNPSVLVPTPGCFINDVKRNGYFIKDAKIFGSESTSDATINQIAAKKWLMDKGSLIGCFPIFDNFMGGDFSKTENIYVESVNYEGSGFISGYPSSMMESHLKGFHAITVIGFGKSKTKIRYLDGNGAENEDYIPYWICRNSWTESWGDNGYFKIAMYPINSFLTFEIVQSGMGGLIGVDVADVQDIEKIDKAMCANGECPMTVTNPEDYYKVDAKYPESSEGGEKREAEPEDNKEYKTLPPPSYLKWAIIVLVALGLGYLAYRYVKKKK